MCYYLNVHLQGQRVNMKGTVYGNRLPSGMQVKKGWEPLIKRATFYSSQPTNTEHIRHRLF